MTSKYQAAAKRKIQVVQQDNPSKDAKAAKFDKSIRGKAGKVVGELESPAVAVLNGKPKDALTAIRNLLGTSTASKLKKTPVQPKNKPKPVGDVGMFRYLEPSKNPYGIEKDF